MANPGQQIFKMLCEPGVFSTQPPKEQYEKWQNEFLMSLKTLDMKLIENQFLCGNRITLGDVIVYNEVSMFMALTDKTAQSSEFSKYPNLVKWLTVKMPSHDAIAKLN